MKIWIGAIIVLTVSLLVAYNTISGSIILKIPFKGTTVILDESKKVTTKENNEIVEFSSLSANHSIIVSKEGYFPWTKKIKLERNASVTLSPIFVSQSPSGAIITSADPEYRKIINQIRNDILPTETNPKISSDKTTRLWILNNTIFVADESTTTAVTNPETEITHVSFYKDRSDVVIFSTGNGVYMIETGKNDTQNFMPIYFGLEPNFVENDSNSIFVEDNNSLMQVAI